MFLAILMRDKYYQIAQTKDVYGGRVKNWVFDLGGWMYTFIIVEMLVLKFAHIEYFF